MIFVDTSVWVTALRDARSPESVELRHLLDQDEVALAAPVRLEILGGASRGDRVRLRASLDALPRFFPDEATWDRLDTWVAAASDACHRFGVADLLIAAIAADHGGALWSREQDFERMGRLGFVRLHRPGAAPPGS